MKIAILASGSGSNLQTLIDQLHLDTNSGIEIAVVISDRPKAYALVRAKEAGIPTSVVQLKHFPDRNAFDNKISEIIETHKVELILLAGYMKIFQPSFVRRYRYKLINIHPSLLPAFPGAHAISDTLEYQTKISGVTVHFVDEGVDTGPIIAQVPVPVLDDDDESSLHQRIQAEEHQLYPTVVKWFAANLIHVENRKVSIKSE